MVTHLFLLTLTMKVCVVLSGNITTQGMPELDICVRLERSTRPREVILLPSVHHAEVIFNTHTDLQEHKKTHGSWLTPYNAHTTVQTSPVYINVLKKLREPELPVYPSLKFLPKMLVKTSLVMILLTYIININCNCSG